ncbi:MAG TPA: hypothetical protein VG889_21140 [Rhizomicrobium sp.]|nr:hypothetical protein [Rhizomicrobium sp.]
MRRALTTLLCVVALAGCGRKNEQQAQQPPSSSAFESVPTEKTQTQPQSSGGLFSSSCPTLPAKVQVEAGIKAAMVAIYGPDESTMRFVVTAITPGSDCKTATVAYKGAGTPSTAPMSHDGDKWSVTLFNKPYPVP